MADTPDRQPNVIVYKKYEDVTLESCIRPAGCLLVFLVFAGIIGYIIYLGNKIGPQPANTSNATIQMIEMAMQDQARGDTQQARTLFDQALNDLNATIQANPKSGDAYEYRGLVYQILGNYPQAIADGKKGVEFQQNSSRAYNNLGTSYQASGDLQQALDAYSTAIKRNANCGKAYFNRGIIHLSREEYDLSAVDFSSAIKNSVPSLQNSRQNATQSQFTNEIVQLFLLRSEQADRPEAYAYRGIAYAALGKQPEALDDLNAALGMRADLSAALYQRGQIYYQSGDRQRAAADFERVVALNNDPAMQQAAAEMLAALRSSQPLSTNPAPLRSTEPPAQAASTAAALPPVAAPAVETPFLFPAQEAGVAKVYVTTSDTLYRMNLDGSQAEVAAAGIVSTGGLFIDSPGHRLYLFTSLADQQLRGYDLVHSGGAAAALNIPGFGGQGLAVDRQAGKLFFGLFQSRVYSADLNQPPGFSLKEIVTANQLFMTHQGGQLQLDPGNQQVYISTATGGVSEEDEAQGIYRFQYDGSGLAKILPASRGDGLALDLAAGKLYYADGSDGWTIRRANLDGSGSEAALTLPAPYRFCKSIALDAAHQDMYLLLFDPDSGEPTAAVARAKLDGSGFKILYPLKGRPYYAGYGSLALYLP